MCVCQHPMSVSSTSVPFSYNNNYYNTGKDTTMMKEKIPTAPPVLLTTVTTTATNTNIICRWCKENMVYPKAIDSTHLGLLRDEHETACALTTYTKSQA